MEHPEKTYHSGYYGGNTGKPAQNCTVDFGSCDIKGDMPHELEGLELGSVRLASVALPKPNKKLRLYAQGDTGAVILTEGTAAR